MASRAARFTQSDLTKAIKGARAGGINPRRIEIDPSGRIIICTTDDQHGGANPWDEVLQ
jgi:hypothetical protein